MEVKSVVRELLEKLDNSTDIVYVRQTSITYISSKRINKEDKKKILYKLNNISNVDDIYSYLVNALLKFESLGVVKDFC